MSSNNIQQAKSKKIIINTLMLYIRMGLTMLVAMYTSRIVINALGIEDYGIYSVVGGIVGMFMFINTTMAAATQRFITIEIGRNDTNRLSKIYSTSINVHIIISLIIFILAETIGLWWVNYKLVINPTRIFAANIVYQFSILSTILIILQVPYNALIIAYEKMGIYAYMGIAYTIFRLLIVYMLLIVHVDKLILYACAMTSIDLIMFIVYKTYCKKSFVECRYQSVTDKLLYKEIMSFAGWNLCGNIAGTCSRQGIDIVLNLFFGTTINAARAIAAQLTGAIAQFVANFQTAMNPQITKSYVANDFSYLHTLIYNGGKYSFLLLYAISLPIIIEMPYVLKIWINIVPDYAVMFCRIALVDACIQTLSGPLITAMLATGDIKKYQLVVSSIILLILPISYLLLKIGFSPVSVMLTIVVISILSFIARFVMLQHKIQLSMRLYIKSVIYPILVIIGITLIPPMLIHEFVESSIYRVCYVGVVSVFVSGIAIYYIALDKLMRSKVQQWFADKIHLVYEAICK